MAGYEALSLETAKAFVTKFLEKRPDPQLLATLRSFIAPVRLTTSDPDKREKLKASLLAACLDIASSSVTDYPYGLNDRFNPDEKNCFFEILESFST
jgi:type IV secretory pathway TrbF-like protein